MKLIIWISIICFACIVSTELVDDLPRFASTDTNSEINTVQKKRMIFDVYTYLLREDDEKDKQDSSIKLSLEFNDVGVTIINKDESRTTIPFIEFQFFDGEALFTDFKGAIEKIHTAPYLAVFQMFRNRIERIRDAHFRGESDFNKKCSFAFRKLWSDTDKTKPKINECVVFCFSRDDEVIVHRMRDDYVKSYTTSMEKEYRLVEMQLFPKGQYLIIQFYDPLLDLTGLNPVPPPFYTKFNEDGLVVLTEPSPDPNKVKFSFRYDQILNCLGADPRDLRSELGKKAENFQPNECCVAYEVEWQKKLVIHMVCSLYKKSNQCKTEIKLYRASMYRYCMESHVNTVYKKYKNKINFVEEPIEQLIRVQYINILKQLKENIFEDEINNNQVLVDRIKELKGNADDILEKLMRKFALESLKQKEPAKEIPMENDFIHREKKMVIDETQAFLDSMKYILFQDYVKKHGKPKEVKKKKPPKKEKVETPQLHREYLADFSNQLKQILGGKAMSKAEVMDLSKLLIKDKKAVQQMVNNTDTLFDVIHLMNQISVDDAIKMIHKSIKNNNLVVRINKDPPNNHTICRRPSKEDEEDILNRPEEKDLILPDKDKNKSKRPGDKAGKTPDGSPDDMNKDDNLSKITGTNYPVIPNLLQDQDDLPMATSDGKSRLINMPSPKIEAISEPEGPNEDKPPFGECASGKTEIKKDPNGKPLLPMGSDDKPFIPFDSDGKPILPKHPDGRPFIPEDENGKPILPINKEGQPFVPLDQNGNPILNERDEKVRPNGEKIPPTRDAPPQPEVKQLGPDTLPFSPEEKYRPDGTPVKDEDFGSVGPDGLPISVEPKVKPIRRRHDGKPISEEDVKTGPDGKPIPDDVKVGPDGVLTGPDGKPISDEAKVGPDGTPISDDVKVGPDGEPAPKYINLGPDAKPITEDGLPIIGPDGLPVSAVKVSPEGKLITEDGQPFLGPDGKPVTEIVKVRPDGKPSPAEIKVGPEGQLIPDDVKVGPDGQLIPEGFKVGPEGQLIPEGVKVGPDGQLIPEGYKVGPDGQLIPDEVKIGPDGQPIPDEVPVGPDGKPIPDEVIEPGYQPLPDEVIIGPDGQPLPDDVKIGPDGVPVEPDGQPRPDLVKVGPDGKPLPFKKRKKQAKSEGRRIGPDGKPIPPSETEDEDEVPVPGSEAEKRKKRRERMMSASGKGKDKIPGAQIARDANGKIIRDEEGYPLEKDDLMSTVVVAGTLPSRNPHLNPDKVGFGKKKLTVDKNLYSKLQRVKETANKSAKSITKRLRKF